MPVTQAFVSNRTVGVAFDCSMLLPRFVVCSACEPGPGENKSVYFQPSPAAETILPVGSCTHQCGGNLCANVLDVPQAYFESLRAPPGRKFECDDLL